MNAPSPVPLLAPAPGEQLRYAAWLEGSARAGLICLVVAYFTYVLGLVAPLVPLDRLPAVWSQPASEYALQLGGANAWGGLTLAPRSDLLNLFGITILAGSSILCLLAVIPLYARRGERAYVAVCCLQIAVLLLAASGHLRVGH